MKIVGMMVVGPGEADRWLEPVLKQRKELVDDMIIATNNATSKEKKLIKKYGFWQYEDNREWGLHQPRIKTDLLLRVGKLRPHWVLSSDADEIYDKYFTRMEADKLAATGDIGFYFYVVNLWGDEAHHRKDMGFWNIRFFRYAPEFGLHFAQKNVHCGLAPPVVYYHGSHAPFILKHYGIMNAEDRAQKVERYKKYDPRAEWLEDSTYYKLLSQDTGGDPFDEDEWHEKVKREAESYKEKPKVIEKKIHL